MKILKTLWIFAMLLGSIASVQAQTDENAKKLLAIAAVKQAVQDLNFEFAPEYAQGQNGKSKLYSNISAYPSANIIFKDKVITSYLAVVKGDDFITYGNVGSPKGTQFVSKNHKIDVQEKNGKYYITVDLLDSSMERQLSFEITPDGKNSTLRMRSYGNGSTTYTGLFKPIAEVVQTQAQ